MIEPDDRAGVADPALPAERDADLDADPRVHIGWQDRVAIGLVLEVEPLPARQRHDARRDALGLERLGRREGQLELRARPDQDQLRVPARRLAQDVAAAVDALAREPVRAGQGRQLLAGEGERDRTVAALDGERPGGGRLVRVARPDEPQVRDRAQRGVVLDRLVGRAVLAEADRIVGPDVDDVEPGERRQPDGAAHVVAEGQERRAVRDEPAVMGDAVGGAAHAVLADAEAQVPARFVGASKFGSPLTSVRLDSDRSADSAEQLGQPGASAAIASWLALRVATSLPVS